MVIVTLILAALGLARRVFRGDSAAAHVDGVAPRRARLDTAALRRIFREAEWSRSLREAEWGRNFREAEWSRNFREAEWGRFFREAQCRRYFREVVRRPVPALSAAVALLGLGVALTASALAEC
ncbi:hypothetical protein [Nocardia xishanensis]